MDTSGSLPSLCPQVGGQCNESPLTAKGIKQAEALGKHLVAMAKSRGPFHVHASTAVRARGTAALMLKTAGVSMRTACPAPAAEAKCPGLCCLRAARHLHLQCSPPVFQRARACALRTQALWAAPTYIYGVVLRACALLAQERSDDISTSSELLEISMVRGCALHAWHQGCVIKAASTQNSDLGLMGGLATSSNHHRPACKPCMRGPCGRLGWGAGRRSKPPAWDCCAERGDHLLCKAHPEGWWTRRARTRCVCACVL